MISAVAFCPQTPLLVPDVGQGAAPELETLRDACRVAVRRIAAPGRQLVVIGAGPEPARHGPAARGTLAGFGVPLEVPLGSRAPGPVELPPALTVGAWLLGDALGPDSGAVGRSVGPDGDCPDGDCPDLGDRDVPIALLVIGDGSARRSIAAPGYLDERAAPYDAAVARALRTGDAGALAGLDAELGAQLLAQGVPAWRAAGALLAGPVWKPEVLFEADPYGVEYLVATWTVDA